MCFVNHGPRSHHLLAHFANSRPSETITAPAATIKPTGVSIPGEKMTGSSCSLRDRGRKAKATSRLPTASISRALIERFQKSALIVAADIRAIAMRTTVEYRPYKLSETFRGSATFEMATAHTKSKAIPYPVSKVRRRLCQIVRAACTFSPSVSARVRRSPRGGGVANVRQWPMSSCEATSGTMGLPSEATTRVGS